MIVFICVIFFQRHEQQRPRVAVVLSDSDSNQWYSLKYGLRMAAEDHKVDVVFISTEIIESMEEEVKIIQFAIQKGADAVIVQPIPGVDAEQILRMALPKIPVMLIESAAGYDRSQSDFPTTEADAASMGKQLVQELLADCDGDIRGKRIGVFSSDMASDVTREKKNTVYRLVIRDNGLVILEKQPPVDAVLALDDRSVVIAGKCVADDRLHGAWIYGIGNSTEAVYYLDNDYAKCLIVPDEFDAGYQSMSAVVDQLNGIVHDMEDITAGYTVLRRDELFTDENQELLFIMSQ